jgi:hypothetical protein
MTDSRVPLTLPLTAAFRPVLHRCDGHKPFQRLTLEAHLRAFLLPLLAASNRASWSALAGERAAETAFAAGGGGAPALKAGVNERFVRRGH